MAINTGKVLICDDSILARKQIKDVISMVGTPTILEASDGEGAIEMYKAVLVQEVLQRKQEEP